MKTAALVLAVVAAAYPQAADFNAARSTAEVYLGRGDVAGAIPHLERAHKLDPSHYSTSFHLALAWLKSGRLDDAHSLIDTMIARGDRAELHNLLAEVELQSGDAQAAAEEYERAARLEPSAKHLFDWGDFLLRRRAYDAALGVFRQGVERHPRSAPLRVGLGIVEHWRGNYDQAVLLLCEAVDLDPADPRPMTFLGSMIDVSPKLAAAIMQRFAGFVQRYPNNAQAHYFYSMSLWKQAESESAGVPPVVESHLKRAVALDAAMDDAFLQLGLYYERAGQDVLAVRAFEQTTKLKPDSEKAHYRLAQLYRKLGQHERARQELEAYRRLRKAQ